MLSDAKIKEIAVQLRDVDVAAIGVHGFLYQGTSMNPILSAGDRVLVKRTYIRELRFGDIVVYEKNGNFIIHRYLYTRWTRRGEPYIIAKADNSSKRDDPVPSRHIVGRVVEIDKGKRRIRLESSFWRRASPFIAATSVAEDAIFEIMKFTKKRFLKRLKVDDGVKKKTAAYIRMPRTLISKLLT